MTKNNVDYVRNQIDKKNMYKPYYATANLVRNAVTDFDHFPYTRSFRGVYYNTKPGVLEREAGFRNRHDNDYRKKLPLERELYPRNCFEGPCSVVYPCYPQYLRKYADKEELEVMLNRVAVTQPP